MIAARTFSGPCVFSNLLSWYHPDSEGISNNGVTPIILEFSSQSKIRIWGAGLSVFRMFYSSLPFGRRRANFHIIRPEGATRPFTFMDCFSSSERTGHKRPE